MRTQSIIAHFPQLGGTVLGCALIASSTVMFAAPVWAAPKAAAAAPAAAEAPDAAKKKAAREAYGAGEKAFAAGDYTGAFNEFKKAHDLIPTIHAEYWMAMCQSHGDDMGAAYDALSAVVASPDAQKLGEEKLSAATARLAEVKKTPATVTVSSTPPGAEISVDGASQPGVTPTTITVPAGTHSLGVGLAGHDAYEADFTVKPGQKLDQSIELKESPPAVAATPVAPPVTEAPPAAPPPAKEEHSKVPAYITLGVGVVGAGVGTVFGISALNAKSDFNKNPTSSGADKAERDALIADMGFAVALTLGITGIVLLCTGDSSSEVSAHETTAPRLVRAKLEFAPVITSTVQGGAARLTF